MPRAICSNSPISPCAGSAPRALFDDSWRFVGLGSLRPDHVLPLGPPAPPGDGAKMPLDAYEQFMSSIDIGVSLMLAPHPSVVPFEFAATGAVVVTNTYENRSKRDLQAICRNITPVPPQPRGGRGGPPDGRHPGGRSRDPGPPAPGPARSLLGPDLRRSASRQGLRLADRRRAAKGCRRVGPSRLRANATALAGAFSDEADTGSSKAMPQGRWRGSRARFRRDRALLPVGSVSRPCAGGLFASRSRCEGATGCAARRRCRRTHRSRSDRPPGCRPLREQRIPSAPGRSRWFRLGCPPRRPADRARLGRGHAGDCPGRGRYGTRARGDRPLPSTGPPSMRPAVAGSIACRTAPVARAQWT